MRCLWGGGYASLPPLEVQTSTVPYYSEAMPGAALAQADGRVTFTWTDAQRRVVGTGARAAGLPPGTYHVTACDARAGTRATATVQVSRAQLPVVAGYACDPASHEAAWDGRVRAHVDNATTHQFLWSTGAITLLPELGGLRPGTYSASVLDPSGRAVPYVHACEAAEVGFRV